MPKPRSQALARHLVAHRLDASIPFAELARSLEPHLDARPALGLFVDADDAVIRLGGLDLHGDILIRPEGPGDDRRILAACRHGDRATLEALLASTQGLWARSAREPSARDGLDLLDCLQADPIVGCLDRLEFADRALEDAFLCREFTSLAVVRRRLVGLNTRAGRPELLLDIIWGDYAHPDGTDETRANTPHTIVHRGEKLVLCLRERVTTRRGSALTLHYTLRPERRTCVIGAITERRRAR